MGYASEMQIEEMNDRYETDAEYRREYDEWMEIECALEADFFAREKENEKQTEWFDDLKIDYSGYTEQRQPEPDVVLVDEDLPF